MIGFANAKINIGLHVTEKRDDGYHNLETIFYTIPLLDVVEVNINDKNELYVYNQSFSGSPEENLCRKAYRLLAADFDLPPMRIDLLKNIPVGAGLGGGSSDATQTLQLINTHCALGLSVPQLIEYAKQLGADCPFFVENKPVYATGIGTTFEPLSLDLRGYHLVVIKPKAFVSTAEAYAGVRPKVAEVDLREAVQLPIQEWKYHIKNDFEFSILMDHPSITEAKFALYDAGALYASMSGSGSAVYGIFEEAIDTTALRAYGEVFARVWS